MGGTHMCVIEVLVAQVNGQCGWQLPTETELFLRRNEGDRGHNKWRSAMSIRCVWPAVGAPSDSLPGRSRSRSLECSLIPGARQGLSWQASQMPTRVPAAHAHLLPAPPRTPARTHAPPFASDHPRPLHCHYVADPLNHSACQPLSNRGHDSVGHLSSASPRPLAPLEGASDLPCEGLGANGESGASME